LNQQGHPFPLDPTGILGLLALEEDLEFFVQVEVDEGLERVERFLN